MDLAGIELSFEQKTLLNSLNEISFCIVLFINDIMYVHMGPEKSKKIPIIFLKAKSSEIAKHFRKCKS